MSKEAVKEKKKLPPPVSFEEMVNRISRAKPDANDRADSGLEDSADVARFRAHAAREHASSK